MAKVRYLDLSGGINRGVNPELTRDNEAEYILNMRPDILGSWRVRQGYTQVGDTIETGKTIYGLHQFVDKAGTKTLYAVCNNAGDTAGQIKYLNGSTWTSLTATIPAYKNIEFADFINYTFMCGNGMATQSIAGGAANPSTVTNVTGAPQALFPIVYKDRLYLINITNLGGTAYPSRFYWSSIPSGSPLAITWDTANDYEAFAEDDGSGIVGAVVAHDRLYLFKGDKFGFWDNTQIRELYGVGCADHRTIKEYNGVIYWMDKKGAIWSFDGSSLQKLSKKVDDYTYFAVYNAAYGYVNARIDQNGYYLFVGNPNWPDRSQNYNSVEWDLFTPTYSKGAELAYFFEGGWAVNGYQNWINIYCTSIDSFGREYHHFGSDGKVYLLGQGDDDVGTDDGSLISYVYLSKEISFGIPEEEKYIIEGYPYGRNLELTNFGIFIGDTRDEVKLGQVQKKKKIPIGKSANYFRFMYSGMSGQTPPRIDGAGFDLKINSK